MKDNNKFIIILTIIIAVSLTLYLQNRNKDNTPEEAPISEDLDFDIKMIRETNNNYSKQNYMISPLSIGYALSMVNEGANEETKEQISNLLGNYKLENSINIKDKIGIANLLFIKNENKQYISKDFINTLKTTYDSDILFDEFKTPKPVNDWVSKKTFNMINDAVDNLSSDFILGIANAIAIDVEWDEKFKCSSTTEEEFIKEDNTKMKTAMMHSTNDVTYIENDNAKGIIKDYAIYDKNTGEKVRNKTKDTIALEYIAILPNDSIDNYIKEFDKDELKNLLNNKRTPSDKLDINLSLPKYTYDFDYKKFQDSLIKLGMSDAFNPEKANFKTMLDSNTPFNIYISKSIHKSHIELSENGTKASAVTVFTFDKNSAYIPQEKEKIDIKFDKPFIYIIKEKESNNIWFFGTVYDPLKFEDSKCEMNY